MNVDWKELTTTIYFKVILIVFIILLVWGFLAPKLISAQSTIAVILGILVLVISVPLVGKLIHSLLKQIKEEENEV